MCPICNRQQINSLGSRGRPSAFGALRQAFGGPVPNKPARLARFAVHLQRRFRRTTAASVKAPVASRTDCSRLGDGRGRTADGASRDTLRYRGSGAADVAMFPDGLSIVTGSDDAAASTTANGCNRRRAGRQECSNSRAAAQHQPPPLLIVASPLLGKAWRRSRPTCRR